MKDFTLTTYKKLLQVLLANDYSFQTLQNFIQQPNNKKIVILRHDVDRLPGNSLKMAIMENDEGVRASYYFRIVEESFDEDIIRQIVEMGHEIGYHYENLSDPQITPVRFSEPTGQAQINADEEKKDFLWKPIINPFGWMNRMVGWKEKDSHPGEIRSAVVNEFHGAGINTDGRKTTGSLCCESDYVVGFSL